MTSGLARTAMAVGSACVLTVVASGCARVGSLKERTLREVREPAPLLPRIPRDAPRFEIDSVSDSTATFRVHEAKWVRRGMSSYVVDPLQRDALVARLRIIARDSLSATAVVTSQVSRVKTDHFLLVPKPTVPWWRSREFWAGSILGLTLGAGSVAVSR